MNTIQHFENENLESRGVYLCWLLLAVAGLIGAEFLFAAIKYRGHSGSTLEWIFVCAMVLVLVIYFILYKRLVSITFDASNRKITLSTTTLIGGTKTRDYNYSDISFESGRDPASFRSKATQFIEIYQKAHKLIKLQRDAIGAYPFDNILDALQQLKNSG